MKNVYVDSFDVVDLETLEQLKKIYLNEYDKLNNDKYKQAENLEYYYKLEGKLELLDDLIDVCTAAERYVQFKNKKLNDEIVEKLKHTLEGDR